MEALEGSVSARTLWLIAHHMDAVGYREGTLGHRARNRLLSDPNFDDLMLLRDLDDAGRVAGGAAVDLEVALDTPRRLDQDDSEPFFFGSV